MSLLDQSKPAEKYVHLEYPKMLYSKEGKTQIVTDPDEHNQALETGWFETPDCAGSRREEIEPPKLAKVPKQTPKTKWKKPEAAE
jgi:hypothetical protein